MAKLKKTYDHLWKASEEEEKDFKKLHMGFTTFVRQALKGALQPVYKNPDNHTVYLSKSTIKIEGKESVLDRSCAHMYPGNQETMEEPPAPPEPPTTPHARPMWTGIQEPAAEPEPGDHICEVPEPVRESYSKEPENPRPEIRPVPAVTMTSNFLPAEPDDLSDLFEDVEPAPKIIIRRKGTDRPDHVIRSAPLEMLKRNMVREYNTFADLPRER